jgi:hypothetical protein
MIVRKSLAGCLWRQTRVHCNYDLKDLGEIVKKTRLESSMSDQQSGVIESIALAQISRVCCLAA